MRSLGPPDRIKGPTAGGEPDTLGPLATTGGAVRRSDEIERQENPLCPAFQESHSVAAEGRPDDGHPPRAVARPKRLAPATCVLLREGSLRRDLSAFKHRPVELAAFDPVLRFYG